LATRLRYVAQASKALAAQLYESWAYESGLALRIDDSVIEARRSAVALWRELGRIDKVGLNLRWLSRLHWYRGEARQAEEYVDDAVRAGKSVAPVPELAMAYSQQLEMKGLLRLPPMSENASSTFSTTFLASPCTFPILQQGSGGSTSVSARFEWTREPIARSMMLPLPLYSFPDRFCVDPPSRAGELPSGGRSFPN
jgi:hypothetical protein